MTPENFVFWLQGFLEISDDVFEKGITPAQARIVQDHLDLVLHKVTPGPVTNVDPTVEPESLPDKEEKGRNGKQLYCSKPFEPGYDSGILVC